MEQENDEEEAVNDEDFGNFFGGDLAVRSPQPEVCENEVQTCLSYDRGFSKL